MASYTLKVALQYKMVQDTDKLALFLSECGFKSPRLISDSKLRMGWDCNSSGNSTIVDIERMTFKRFSSVDEVFMLFDMIALKMDYDEEDTVKLISTFFNVNTGNKLNMIDTARIVRDRMKNAQKIVDETYEIIPESAIREIMPCNKFLDDYISIETQMNFMVHYSDYDNRIIMNWRDVDGNIVGFVGRLNVEGFVFGYETKYFTYGHFKKGLHLFGFYENKEHILANSTVIISESEKATMQMSSYGMKLGVSLGSSSLSKGQLNILNKFEIKKVILNFDEDKDIGHIKKTYERIKKSTKNIHVYYIRCDGLNLKRQSNICDFGEEAFYRYLDIAMVDAEEEFSGVEVINKY